MTDLKVIEVQRKPDEQLVKMVEKLLERVRSGETTALVAMELDARGNTKRHGVGAISFPEFVCAIELWKHDLIHQYTAAIPPPKA